MNGRHRESARSSFIDDAAAPDGLDLTAGRSRPLAGWRYVWLALALLGAWAFLARDAAAQIVAGPNANIGGGPACRAADPGCPFQVFGDITIQRQNEGSMACSSRNPQTCLAAGNDYRLVGLPSVIDGDGKVTADAWLGIFWSRNGGQAWRSTLLPGWKTDHPSVKDMTAEGAPAVNPIAGFQAAADPTLRAGTHGLFYLSGIAFNRSEEANGTGSALRAGGEGKSGVQFASVFIDDNDSSDPNKPPRYLRTTVVDSGTSGRFLDKPWIIADIPRGLATCTIPAGPNGVPAAQTIQSGMVYVAYATFLGSGNNPHSDVWVKSSNDCGATWSNGAKLTASVPLNQSPIIVVNPVNGNLHVVWREFGQSGSADRILMASSTNGAKTFSKVSEVTSLGVPQPLPENYHWPANVSTAFDQTTLPNPGNNLARMARTNGYPSACVGTDGVLRIAFAKRLSQPGAPAGMPEFARIMFGTLNGNIWSIAPIDNHAGPGHQFQPALACTGTRATAIWYDQRGDAAFNYPQLPWVFFPFTVEPTMQPVSRTVDVRAVQTDASGVFQPGSSIQVSKYPLAYDTASQEFVQLQYNFLNFALFGGGQVPFLGDYLEVVPKNPFTPPLCKNAACTEMTDWAFNTFANESPLVHGLWTDNRDVLQKDEDVLIETIDWASYSAPGPACMPTSLTWTRNQNLYTSLLGAGFVLQAEGNARRTKDLEKRAYVVQLQNLVPPVAGQSTTLRKRFRLTFGPLSGEASFSFATDFTSLSDAEFLAAYGRHANPVVNTIFVDVPYASGAARTVFVRKNSTAPVIVAGEEVRAFASDGTLIPIDSCTQASAPCAPIPGGLKSRVIVAPDPQAPVQALNEESHDADFTLLPVLLPGNPTPASSVTYPYPLIPSSLVLSDPNFSNNLLNPTWTNPTWTSPTWTSPTWTSPTWTSPTWTSPTWTSPTWTSPTWTSPTWTSPTWTSPTWTSQVITETSYLAQGTGTVTSGYDLDALILSLPQGAILQALVSKVTSVPGTNTCTPGTQIVLQPVANVTSLNGLANTSFSLAPGEQAVVTLRVACDAANGSCYTPTANTSVVLSKQAPDCTTSPELVNPDLPKCEMADRFDIFDTAAPTIAFSPAAPANVLQGTGPAGAVVPYSASATDSVDALLGISVAVSCTKDGQPVPSSSTTTLFGYGTTTITCTSTDSHGNSVTTNFTITVIDTVPPAVTGPGSVMVQATSPSGATYSFTASALDNVDGAVTPVCTPASGSTFAIGTTMVTCTATDNAANAASESFAVTVVDTVKPVLLVPANISALTTGGGPTASVTYTASATDLGQSAQVSCSSAVGVVSSFQATQLFPVGTTTVTCVANDGRGNTATGAFTVSVALGYGILGPLSPYQAPPKTYNSGSSVPIAWKYTIAGVAVASPFPAWQPQVRFVKVLNWRNCANSGTESTAPQDTFINSATPGNSYFMYSSDTLIWKLNWDSPMQPNTCWNIYIGTVDRAPISVGRLQLK